MEFALSDVNPWGATRLWIAGGSSLVLDPIENLLPMDLDVLRRIDSDTNLGTFHAKDRHDGVRTDPNGFANSPREYQHVSLPVCLEITIIVATRPNILPGT